MQLHIIRGYWGYGKTSVIASACVLLSKYEIKAGVVTNPEQLKKVIAELIHSLRNETKARIREMNTLAFKSGFSNPTHRITDVL